MRLNALFRLAFASAPHHWLTLPHTVTRWLILQKARCRGTCPLQLLVNQWFQVLFHSPPGVLFTFPSRYWFTIGHQRYLALGSGLPRFPRGFTCPVVLRYLSEVAAAFAYGALTLFGRPFQDRSSSRAIGNSTMTGPTTPQGRTLTVWAFPRSLATTRGIISFPRGT